MVAALATVPRFGASQHWWDFEGTVEHLAPGAENYFRRAVRWYPDGVVLPDASRHAVAALWKVRPDLRYFLGCLVHWYPCAEFLRPFFRDARRGCGGAYFAWFALFPQLRELLRPRIIERARRVNTGFTAIDACLLWARLYDGGDEAYRHLACAIHRDDVRQSHAAHPNGFLRHDLETHGTLTRKEAEQVNVHLLQIKNARLLNHWA
jgi:hypothetical protein